jgi:hypothetical protein
MDFQNVGQLNNLCFHFFIHVLYGFISITTPILILFNLIILTWFLLTQPAPLPLPVLLHPLPVSELLGMGMVERGAPGRVEEEV